MGVISFGFVDSLLLLQHAALPEPEQVCAHDCGAVEPEERLGDRCCARVEEAGRVEERERPVGRVEPVRRRAGQKGVLRKRARAKNL